MIKRHPNPDRKHALPLATPVNLDDSEMVGKHPRKSNMNNRRYFTGKRSIVFRVIAGTLFLVVLSLYIYGMQHVLLHSASSSRRGVFHGFVRDSKFHHDLPIPSPSSVLVSSSQKPRVLGHYFSKTDSVSYVGTEQFPPDRKLFDNAEAHISRGIFMTTDELNRQIHLRDSEDYASGDADTMADMGENCVAQYDWQEKSFPTCNFLMEVDMTNLNHIPMFETDHYNNRHDKPLDASSLHSYTRFLANGYWRDVWAVDNLLRNNGALEETVVLKTMRYKHNYKPRNYDRHRRDAVAMERLTASTFIMDIYASCANSGLFQFADGGSIHDAIWYNYHKGDDEKVKPWSSKEKLVVAYQAVSGLADLHNFAKEGVAAIAHTDITTSQFVFVSGAKMYKLNDFNRARFIAKNNKTNESCTYEVGNNPGKVRC